jgi:hypothetical protein
MLKTGIENDGYFAMMMKLNMFSNIGFDDPDRRPMEILEEISLLTFSK